MALNQRDIGRALLRLEPTGAFIVDGDTLGDITWLSGSDPAQPADGLITAEVADLQAEDTAAQYLQDRRQAWRDQGVDPFDLIDALYKAVLEADTTEADAYNSTRGTIETTYPEIASP